MGKGLTKDPIGFGGGSANLYQYVGNNPVNFTDPSGLELFDEEQTRFIIRNAVLDYAETGDEKALFMAVDRHTGEYDFKYSGHTFVVNGIEIQGDEFGNYLAGYATWDRFGEFGEFATKTIGDIIAGGTDDPGSLEFINRGIYDAQVLYDPADNVCDEERGFIRQTPAEAARKPGAR